MDKITPIESGQTFTSFVRRIGDGALHERLSEVLREMNESLGRAVAEFGGVAKGRITLVFDFKSAAKLGAGAYEIEASIAVKPPKLPEYASVMWTAPGNNFTADSPRGGRQIDMFPAPRPQPIAAAAAKE
jgi:hypothetical protein